MAIAGHELRTPTAVIHNYLQLVDRHLADGDAAEAGACAARALVQTGRLAALIERLLDVGRIESGQLELWFTTVDLDSLVRSAVETARVLPGAPPIIVRTGTRPVLVRADPGRLEQVLLNLLSNAVEHAPGSPTIEVTVGVSGRSAEVAVRDHGAGIMAEEIPTIFEPYARLRGPSRSTGLGLGLYLAREIVTAHGGDIEVVSRLGEGTVLTVRLPLPDRRARVRAADDRRRA